MSSISAVTFDLWQTLLIDSRELGLARTRLRIEGTREALKQEGYDFSEESLWQAYRQCYRTCREVRTSGRDVTFTEQVRIFISNIEDGILDRLKDSTVKQIADAYGNSFFELPPEPHQQAAPLLEQVKELGYRIGLISNTGMTPGVIFRSYLQQIGILHYFDALTFSDEVQLSKPAPAIFRAALDSLDMEAEQVVHVGDHLLNDVTGAKGVGMRAIWIEGFDNGEMAVKPDFSVSRLGEVAGVLRSLA